jgi:hypothetical protein
MASTAIPHPISTRAAAETLNVASEEERRSTHDILLCRFIQVQIYIEQRAQSGRQRRNQGKVFATPARSYPHPPSSHNPLPWVEVDVSAHAKCKATS